MPKIKPAVKVQHLCTIECPYCAKILEVIREIEIIAPAEPADKKERFYAEKSTQKTLDVSQAA